MSKPAHKVISARLNTFAEMDLSRRKRLIAAPKRGCLSSQRRNLGDERKLRIVARIKNGTVGRTGTKTPSTPNPIHV